MTLILSFRPRSGETDWSVRISFLLTEYCVRCMVAPRNESSMLPPTPATAPQNMSGGRIVIQLPLQCVFSIISETNIVAPIDKPPNKLARVPPSETPPFVPGGTDLSVVIRTGGWEERMPSSEARVSPRQQAKWPSTAKISARLNPFDIVTSNGHHSPSSYDTFSTNTKPGRK